LATDEEFEHVKKLLKRRGYSITEVARNEEEGIIDVYAEAMKETREGKRAKRRMILRVLCEAAVVGVEAIRSLAKAREEGGFHEAVLIGGERYTYAARREAMESGVELLHRRFLFIDLFMHYLVPEHDITPEEEVREIEEKYGIDRTQLPKIKAGDPAAKAIGARPGDVIRIVRESPTAGRHIVYRYCVP